MLHFYFIVFYRSYMLFNVLDVLGTMAFAISGVLTALNKKLDLFGVFIIAFVTALGGGTLRDVLIGNTPVGWMLDLQYLYAIFLSVVFALWYRKKLSYWRKSLFLFDTIGLGVCVIVGVEKGVAIGLSPIICIALGTMTASFGGVIRDMLSNEIPVIFRKEIYATACIAGGILFFILQALNLPKNVIYILTSLLIVGIRIIAVKKHLRLPTIR